MAYVEQRERMIAISTEEYKDLAEIKIRADLLWQKCLKMKHEDGVAQIGIDDVQFMLNATDNYDGLPWEFVPPQAEGRE